MNILHRILANKVPSDASTADRAPGAAVCETGNADAAVCDLPVRSPVDRRAAQVPPLRQYRTSFSVVPPTFPDYEGDLIDSLIHVTPRPPKGDDWRLISSSSMVNARHETVLLFFWERPWVTAPKLGY